MLTAQNPHVKFSSWAAQPQKFRITVDIKPAGLYIVELVTLQYGVSAWVSVNQAALMAGALVAGCMTGISDLPHLRKPMSF